MADSVGMQDIRGLNIDKTVKGFALATKKAMVGVPTLDVMACNVKRDDCFIAPIVDAKRGNVYASLYSFKDGKLRRHLKYSVLPVSEFLNHIKGKTGGESHLPGLVNQADKVCGESHLPCFVFIL